MQGAVTDVHEAVVHLRGVFAETAKRTHTAVTALRAALSAALAQEAELRAY